MPSTCWIQAQVSSVVVFHSVVVFFTEFFGAIHLFFGAIEGRGGGRRQREDDPKVSLRQEKKSNKKKK